MALRTARVYSTTLSRGGEVCGCALLELFWADERSEMDSKEENPLLRKLVIIFSSDLIKADYNTNRMWHDIT